MLKNKLCVAVHFVWATWDRQPLITEAVERDLYKYIEAVCADDHCKVLALGGMPDHVHLLVLLSNTVTMADFMRHVKGGSSRFIPKCLTPGSWFAWQGSYGAFSVSQANIPKSGCLHPKPKTAPHRRNAVSKRRRNQRNCPIRTRASYSLRSVAE